MDRRESALARFRVAQDNLDNLAPCHDSGEQNRDYSYFNSRKNDRCMVHA